MAAAQHELMDRVREHHRTIEGLTRIGPEGLSPDRLMNYVVAQVSRVTKIDRTKILRYRPEKGDLLIVAGVGWNPDVVGNVALGADYQSPAGRAFQTTTPVAIRNPKEAKEYRYPDVLREHGIVSLLNVPIMINGHTWGVLEVDSASPSDFDDWDIHFFTTVANIMGVCLALSEANEKHLNAIAEFAVERTRFDTVMREFQHRVKNNLTIIVSFSPRKCGNFLPTFRRC